jgi:translation elongation factor EF-Ts
MFVPVPLLQAASEWLRKKGLASADKKAGRLAAEGGVLAYIHPGSRLGVLLEVNCETDFVAAGEVFNRLANTLAMQIAASTVEYVAADEIPADVFEKEKEIEMGREDLQSKPEAIRAKIAEGRVKKLVQVGVRVCRSCGDGIARAEIRVCGWMLSTGAVGCMSCCLVEFRVAAWSCC